MSHNYPNGRVENSTGAGQHTPILVTTKGHQLQRLGGKQVPVAGSLATRNKQWLLAATPGRLAALSVLNTNASAQWYCLFDVATIVGADTTQNLVDVFPVSGNSKFLYPFELEFGTGLVVLASSTNPYSAFTASGNDSLVIGKVDL
jgi:hypothetical protein